MGRPKNDQPSYLQHKPSGQARVRINGTDHYLGPYNSPESRRLYHQLLAEEVGVTAPAVKLKAQSQRLSIGDLAKAYSVYVREYYGPRSSQVYCVDSALRPLEMWEGLPVDEFTPLKLQQVLERRVQQGDCRDAVRKRVAANKSSDDGRLCRSTVNATLRLLKQMFRWAVSQELVRNEVYLPLTTVTGIRKGRGKLAELMREPEKVVPVPTNDIEATVRQAGPEIAAMIRVQLLAGMRPDEVTIMRPCEIDMTLKPCWSYRPGNHKNDWRGDEKEILLGPKAQKILKPFIAACGKETDYLFCPQKVQQRSIERQLKASGKEPSLVKLSKIKPARPCYDDASYRQAVHRACKRAKVEIWTPNQLRHNAATMLRDKFGIENAQIPLGHKNTNTTEIYAAKNRGTYIDMMKKVG